MMMSNNGTSTTTGHDHQQDMHGYEEADSSSSGSGCLGLFCFDNRREWSLLHAGGEQRGEETWLIKKAKKVKELTEVVAGPKWKNFIRKLGKYTNKSRMAECRQYDAQSYALNFDDGFDDFQQDDNNNALLGSAFSTKL